jgi:hypothetical protein
MERCLKVLNLLIEKKVAEINGDKLKSWEYEGMIKHHIEECPSCRKFLEGMYEKSKISDADSSQIPTELLARLSSPVRIFKKEGYFERRK